MKSGKCLARIVRIKAIEKEHQVALVARDTLSMILKKHPSRLTDHGLEQAHLDAFRDNLDATYLIRVFAEFETGLRDYWKQLPKKRPNARVSDMIRSISSSRKIDFQIMANVEVVRKYRNRLVHEEDSEAEGVEVREARKSLCLFFGRLPENW